MLESATRNLTSGYLFTAELFGDFVTVWDSYLYGNEVMTQACKDPHPEPTPGGVRLEGLLCGDRLERRALWL